MLQIRVDQVEVLSNRGLNAQIKAFAQGLRERFAVQLSERGISDAMVDDFVREGIGAASRHGIVGTSDVRLYLECMLVLSPCFDEDPKFAELGEILIREKLTGTEKMALVHDHLLFGGYLD